MGIAKFDDSIPDAPKFIAAGAPACWLWFASICYCRRVLSDGFVPKGKIPSLVLGLKTPYVHASMLVQVGLWEDAVGGYQVHDFLHWNPSKEQVENYRLGDKERKQEKRRNKVVPSGTSTTDTALSSGTRSTYKSSSESESRVVDLDLRDKSAREGAWSNPHSKPTNLINGADQRRHGQHFWCEPDLARGLCVPYQLHDEFKAKSRREEIELKAWYSDVIVSLGDQPLGDDLYDFWRNHFATWVGTVTVKPSKRGLTAVESNLRGLDADMAALAPLPRIEGRRG